MFRIIECVVCSGSLSVLCVLDQGVCVVCSGSLSVCCVFRIIDCVLDH